MDEIQLAKNLHAARGKEHNADNKVGSALSMAKIASSGNPAVAAANLATNKQVRKKVKKYAYSLTHWPEYIEWSTDGLILIPLFFAIIKDLLDWIGFSLPVLNESLNFSIMGFSALMLAFIGSSSSKASHVKTGIRTSMKWIVLLTGTTIEEIFGINLLPIESLTIVIAFILVIWERMEAGPPVERVKEQDNEEMSYA